MKDDLGNRMKENYENRGKSFLINKIPVIIRVDGKSFHTFCKRFERPYDEFLNHSLNDVMKFLCENVQGVKLAQRHSDEISLLLTDYDSIGTDCWFDYNAQKMSSVAASLATSEFCKLLSLENELFVDCSELAQRDCNTLSYGESWPCFDARCFNLPEHEIANYFWWRMLDAKRNSVSMVAQANFSHKELQGVSSNEMQEMLWQEKQINWAKLPQGQKIGFMCKREKREMEITKGPQKGQICERSFWDILESPFNKTGLDEVIDSIQFVKENQE